MKWPYVLSLLYSIILAGAYGVGQLNPGFMLISSNVLFPVTACVASVDSVWTLRRYVGRNPKPPFSMAWLNFSLGIFMWFIGELTWAIYVLFLHIEPFPSFADVFYLGGYVFLFLALFLILKMFWSAFSKHMFTTMVGITAALSVAVSYLLLIPVFTSSQDTFTIALAATYPVLDIVLFALALSILLIFLEGTIGKAWFFLTLGVILNIVADLLFHYAELEGFYYEGHPFELFWLWGYIAFLLGFYIHRREL